MSDESPVKSEAPKPENPSSDTKGLIKDVTEELKGKVPFAKATENFLFRNGKGLRDGATGFLILAIILTCLCVWGGYQWGYGNGKDKLDEVKGELKDAKQDRDKYELELAPFQAMAIKIYTNTPIEQRLPMLIEQMNNTASNILSSMEEDRPSFEFYINRILITNGYTFYVKQDRHINLTVRNTSKVTADKLSVAIITPSVISNTNLFCDFSWKQQNKLTSGDSGSMLGTNEVGFTWLWVSDNSIGAGNLQSVNPLEFSTNLNYRIVQTQFSIYSIASKKQDYNVYFNFQ